MRWTRQRLIVWTSTAVLLGQVGCAARGITARPDATGTGAPLGAIGRASPEPPKRAWATKTGDCLKDFLRGQGLDPTVIAMLPVVFPLCIGIAALGLQPDRRPTDASASVPTAAAQAPVDEATGAAFVPADAESSREEPARAHQGVATQVVEDVVSPNALPRIVR